MHYTYLAFAILFELSATMMLKLSHGWEKWWWGIASVLCFSVAGFLLGLVLKHMSIGMAYAIWAGTGIALICLASVIFWKQSFDMAAITGIALIIAGTMLITLKSDIVLQ